MRHRTWTYSAIIAAATLMAGAFAAPPSWAQPTSAGKAGYTSDHPQREKERYVRFRSRLDPRQCLVVMRTENVHLNSCGPPTAIWIIRPTDNGQVRISSVTLSVGFLRATCLSSQNGSTRPTMSTCDSAERTGGLWTIKDNRIYRYDANRDDDICLKKGWAKAVNVLHCSDTPGREKNELWDIIK